MEKSETKCRICGRTTSDESLSVQRPGIDCHWVADDLCSVCKTTVVAFASSKGGVGKTHLVSLLARFYAAQGLRVAVIDSDLNDSLSYQTGMTSGSRNRRAAGKMILSMRTEKPRFLYYR
jgi:Mrp family chromosome partitioning ATPase